MGIGEKEFNKLTEKTFNGKRVPESNNGAIMDNTYINTRLGILCEKPADWGFIGEERYETLLNEQIIADHSDIDKEDLLEAGLPIIVIAKYPEDTQETKGKFSPAIVIYVRDKEDIEFEFDSLEEVADFSTMDLSNLLLDFERESSEGPFEISGCPAYKIKATYVFEHIDLAKPVLTNLTILYIEHGDYYYSINMHDSEEVNETAQAEFNTFINSIRMR